MTAMIEPILVLICEPDEASRKEVRAWVESAGFPTGVDAHTRWTGMQRPPYVVVFGLGPDPTADLCSIADIRTAAPRARIVVLHNPDQEATVLETLRLGALAHLCRKGLNADSLVEVLRVVAGGEAVISPRIAGMMLDAVQETRRLR